MRGLEKEKQQVTIRVDTELLNAAKAQVEKDGTHITDLIERGLLLAINESKYDLSQVAKEVRFMAANSTKEQQRLIRGLLIAMVEPLVAPAAAPAALTPIDEKLYELTKWYLERANKLPDASARLESYNAYGKRSKIQEMNCPFYGFSQFTGTDPKHSFPFVLLQSADGSQCGLVTTSHAPCWMEMNRQPIEWKECPYMKELRISVISPVLKPL